MNSPKETPLHWRIFAQEYLRNGQNGAAAYAVAKPNSKPKNRYVLAHVLLKNKKFQAFYQKEKAKIEKTLEMSKEEWLRLLSDVARFNLSDYLEEDESTGDVNVVKDWRQKRDSHVLQRLKVKTTTLETGQVIRYVEIEKENKIKALETIGKACGYIEDKVRLTGDIKVTAAEVAARLKAELGDDAMKSVFGE